MVNRGIIFDEYILRQLFLKFVKLLFRTLDKKLKYDRFN